MDLRPGQLGFDLDDRRPILQPLQDDRPPAPAWWGFSLDHDEQAAVNDFRRRFGADPEQVRHVPGCLLLGPLSDM